MAGVFHQIEKARLGAVVVIGSASQRRNAFDARAESARLAAAIVGVEIPEDLL